MYATTAGVQYSTDPPMNQTQGEAYYECMDSEVIPRHSRQQQITGQSTPPPVGGGDPHYYECVTIPSDNPKPSIIAQTVALDHNEISTSASQQERDESDYCDIIESAQFSGHSQTSTVVKDYQGYIVDEGIDELRTQESQTATSTTEHTDEGDYYINEGLDKPVTSTIQNAAGASSVPNTVVSTVIVNMLTVSMAKDDDQENYVHVNEGLNQVATAKARNDASGDTIMPIYLSPIKTNTTARSSCESECSKHVHTDIADSSNYFEIQTLPNKAYTYVDFSVSTKKNCGWHVNEGRDAATARTRDDNPTSATDSENVCDNRALVEISHTCTTGSKSKVSNVSGVHRGCDYYNNEGTTMTQNVTNTRRHFESSPFMSITGRGHQNKSLSNVERLRGTIDSKARGGTKVPNNKTKRERPSPDVAGDTRDTNSLRLQGGTVTLV